MEQLTGIGQGIFKLATLGGFGAATCAAAFSPSAANISTAFATAAAFAAGSGIFDKRRDEQAAKVGASQASDDMPPTVSGEPTQPSKAQQTEAGWTPEPPPASRIVVPGSGIRIATFDETSRYGNPYAHSSAPGIASPAPPAYPVAASRRSPLGILFVIFVLAALVGLGGRLIF